MLTISFDNISYIDIYEERQQRNDYRHDNSNRKDIHI